MRSAIGPRGTVELASYPRAVARHWLPCCLLALIGLAVGLLLTLATPPRYVSTVAVSAPGTPAYLAVSVDVGTAPRDPREWTQDTEAAMMTSAPVLRTVRDRLGTRESLTELAARVRITVPTSTRIFFLDFAATDPATARRGAQAIAEEYVRYRSRILADRASRVGAALDERRASLQALLAEVQVPGADPTAAPVPVNPVLRGRIQDQITHIDDALGTASLTVANTAEVVRPASTPTRPERRNAEVPPISGLLLGGLAGLATGLLRSGRRPRVHDTDEVSALTGLTVLALIDREAVRSGAASLGLRVLAAQVRIAAAQREDGDHRDKTDDPDDVAGTGDADDTGGTAVARLADPPRALLVGCCADSLVTALADRLREMLVRAGAAAADPLLGDVLVTTGRPDATGTLLRARSADVVLLLAELDHSNRRDLARTSRLLTRAGTKMAAVVVGDHAADRVSGEHKEPKEAVS
ncbi:hypothetical protein [Actinopolymorpha pittospori]|uniref:Chain length determinant protein n=1 Tax=Actinopolymorpha pittospori TaxID=648752 RepID=A0A927N442_9ACTN|nr:hypothetical protein [Actinopolymorpha pittospori]MBE1611966.1 hypothetical protein [Actinopolymorpha pittospori]